MGSLSGVAIPIVPKRNLTFRKSDSRLTRTDSEDDTIGIINLNRPELYRTYSSGSVVREGSSVDYLENIGWGLYFQGRATTARVARDGSRTVQVPDSGIVVIETSLASGNAQKWDYHTGEYIVRHLSTDDSLIDRVLGSGAFD